MRGVGGRCGVQGRWRKWERGVILSATATNTRHGRVWRLHGLKVKVCRSDDAVTQHKISRCRIFLFIFQERMPERRGVPAKLVGVGIWVGTRVS